MLRQITYRQDISNVNNKAQGTIDIAEIAAMSSPEFYQFRNKIVGLRKNRRYDTALFKQAVAIAPGNAVAMFTKGVGENDAWANDLADTYKKSRVHTNMPKGGKFQPDDLVIIDRVEAVVGFNAGGPTTSADGIVSNPLTAAFPTNMDVFELLDVTNRQFYIDFVRGDRQIVAEGRPQDFPQLTGKSGAGGSSATFTSAFSQNIGFTQENPLVKPQVIEGDGSFQLNLTPLADTMTLTGRDIRIELRLHTWEFLQQYT
jgi:hypothetical protein